MARWNMRLVVLSLVVAVTAIAAEDPLAAKRKAAAQLMHDGRTAEALIVLKEIAATGTATYADHLALAKALEKAGKNGEAVAEYHRTQEMLRTAGGGNDERTAKTEVDKRLKALDPVGEKVATATADFEAKLDALEAEAGRARDMVTIARIFKLRGRLWQAEGLADRGFCTVPAAALNVTDSGFEVTAYKTYRVRAAGVWSVVGAKTEHVECTAAGTTARENGYGRIGRLLAHIGDKVYPLGEDMVFTPQVTGKLMFLLNENDTKDREKNTGAMQVLIVQQN